MRLDEALNYIHAFYRCKGKPGLHRIRHMLAQMGNPERKLKFIHIAGTNGKGSTAAMTASILQQAGYRTGLFTSPFIYRFNERMQVDGRQIADEDVIALTEYVQPFVATLDEQPSEFEVVCCMAFTYFLQQNCDVVVLEVGMGGALDATNVIGKPEVAVITNIGLDHTDALGDTEAKIAEAKAGIIKPNGHAVIYRGAEDVEAVFEQVCQERSVSLKKADFDTIRLTAHSLQGQVFDCGSRKDLVLPLLGDHQLHNASVVLSVIDSLIEQGWHITEEDIRQGLRATQWPGRFDVIRQEPLFIIDGGHNPQCIEALVTNIRDYLTGRRVIALTGVLGDKDYADMYRPVMPYVESFVCITPDSPRKLDASLLAEHLRQAGANAVACGDTVSGVRTAMELAGQDGCVLCFGSLYSIGAIRGALDSL